MSAPTDGGETPQIVQKYAKFKLEIRPSEIHRWGVFALEFIPKNRKIIEYTGEKISRRETARRAERPLNYLFTLNNYWTLDGSVGGSGAQYINHCCEPNCYAWIVKDHILYMSARDIQPGEELTIDYRFEPDVPEVKCGCGAPQCRGTINLKKERKPATRHAAKTDRDRKKRAKREA
jgi:SET domain-containing protein